MSNYHVPVLLHECLEGLQIRESGTYVDVTYGGGGHSAEILSRLGPNGKLIAFDKDSDAHLNKPDDSRLTLVKSDFRFIQNYLKFLKISVVDGILADLGVSSHQFDEAERGFSIRFDAALDMRMDASAGTTAADFIASTSPAELASVLREFGELPNAYRIAQALIAATPIHTTGELRLALKPFYREREEHKFLARVFQALRIHVNDEINALRDFLLAVPQVLNPGGRLVVISYHSLEDRLVKNFIRAGKFSGEPDKDFFGNPLMPLKAVNRKVITPSESEQKQNSRSRSAKLRIAEKI
jgi:16S rRNA (cytosine1402-N4)-methyltransferase